MAGTLIVDKIQLDVGNTFQVLSNTGSQIFSANPSGLTFDSGSRIRGDFSNATVANRVMFQTSTSNSLSRIGVIPSGSSQQAHFEAFNNSDPTNSSAAGILCGAAESRVYSAAVGTGTALPMTFYTSGSERARIATNGDFSFNSGYGSAAVAYGCRAWVNFDGTGTVAIRGSGNVSSITDNGTGNYRMNFTTAMPDANYAGVGSTQGSGVSVLPVISINQDNDQTTTFVDIYTTGASTATPADFSYVGVAIFR